MFFVVRGVSRLQSHNGVQTHVTNQPERNVRCGRALELALNVQKLNYPYFMHIHLDCRLMRNLSNESINLDYRNIERYILFKNRAGNKAELIKWNAGIIIAVAGVVTAIVKLIG